MFIRLNKFKTSFFQNKKRKLWRGQIATILTLMIGVIFVLVVLTQVTKKATQKKLMLSNAADGAALLLASRLSSIGTGLIRQYYPGRLPDPSSDGPDWHPSDCDWNVLLIVIAIILLLTFAITWWASALWSVGAMSLTAVNTALVATAGLGTGFGMLYMADLTSFKQYQGIGMYMQSFTMEQQLVEQAMDYAIFSVIDDIGLVPDIYDDDMDGQHGEDTDGDGVSDDRIRSLTQAYYQRLRAIPNQSNNIANFLSRLASCPDCTPPTSGGFVYYTPPSSTTHSITDTVIPDPLYSIGSPIDPTRGFKDWLRGNYKLAVEAYYSINDPHGATALSFPEFLNRMIDAGYAVNQAPTSTFWRYGPYVLADEGTINPDTPPVDYDVYRLVAEIKAFERWSKELLQRSAQELLVGLNEWYSALIDSGIDSGPRPTPAEIAAGAEPIDWTGRLEQWVVILDNWIATLTAQQTTAESCMNSASLCTSNWWQCCYNIPGDPACGTCCSSYTCEPCSDPDPETGESTCSCCEYDCYWYSCCEAHRGCAKCENTCDGSGALGHHGDARGACCPKTASYCCMLWDQPDSGDIDSGGTEYSISRHYIDHLLAFRNRVQAFINEIYTLQTNVNTFNANNSLTHTWTYSWHDLRGDHTVKITIGVPGDFRVPYMGQERHWLGFQTCKAIQSHHGHVNVEIQRYDNEPKTGFRRILDLLSWNKTITSRANAEYDIWKEETTTPGVKLVEPHT